MAPRGKRPVWKGPFFKPFNLPKVAGPAPVVEVAPKKQLRGRPTPNPAVVTAPTESRFELRTNTRSCTILPSFVGHTFHVHNGRRYCPVHISEAMIGHRLGEFAHSKKMAVFRGEDKSKRR